jgi:hypothetical protein
VRRAVTDSGEALKQKSCHKEVKMNKRRRIGGIICLALAALLAVLSLTLPSDEVVFMVGDTNAPFVPVIALAVVGVALLATARKR